MVIARSAIAILVFLVALPRCGKINAEGFTLVPTKMYFAKGKVKVEIAVAKGKKLYDKRQVKKTRDWNREKARLLSKNNK